MAIKVLHVYKTSIADGYGGVQNFIETLCKADALLGVDNTLLALSANPLPDRIQREGYIIHQAKQNFFLASTGFSISAFAMFKELMQKADIIHYHFPNPFADLLHLSCHVDKPTIVTYHSDIVKQKYLDLLYTPLKMWFLDSASHIVATSPNYLHSSLVLQKYHHKTTVIPIGISQTSLADCHSDRLKYWQQKFASPFFLFTGALRYYKGLHVALEALKGSDICLVIAGEGKEAIALKEQAALLGLKNVHFLGKVQEDDKIALLQLCYGFLFPSHLRSEAFGISLLEAAAIGKPLISCEIGTGTTYINSHKDYTGIVVAPNSPLELRSAMEYLLQHPAEARIMGKNAKNRAETLFTDKLQAQKYYALYSSFL